MSCLCLFSGDWCLSLVLLLDTPLLVVGDESRRAAAECAAAAATAAAATGDRCCGRVGGRRAPTCLLREHVAVVVGALVPGERV